MKGETDEGKQMSPMFPRLRIKDAEKGGPKAPPRNKMALYEEFSIPSQNFDSGSASLLPLPLPLRSNCPVPLTSGHVGSCRSIQFCTSIAPSYLAEEIHAYHSGGVNLTKLMPGGVINCKKSVKTFDEETFITTDSAHGRNSRCSINLNIKDNEKLGHCKSSCSLRSQNSISKMVNATGSIEVKSVQKDKNQMKECSEESQIGQKPEVGSAHRLAGFGKMIDASSISSAEFKNPISMKKEHVYLKEEIPNISTDNLKLLKGSDALTHKQYTALRDNTNLKDAQLEKPAVNDVHNCSDGLEIGRKCFQGQGDGHEGAEIYRHYDHSNEPISDHILSPDDVLGVIGEKQFWQTRRNIVNQQRVFLVQVFELHRLIKVQRLIAASPHLLLDNNHLINKPSLKWSALKKLQSAYVTERPSSAAKLNSKSETTAPAECAENNVVGKIPLPCFNNNCEDLVDWLSKYDHHSRNPLLAPAATNTKQSQSIYLLPGNQWLVPVMSPSEGLVYKPFIGPYPPNAGFIAPVSGACSTMSLNPGNKEVSDAAHVPTSHQGFGILSGTSLSQSFPIMHQSGSPSAVEQMSLHAKTQSNGPENHESAGGVKSAILNQSLPSISIQMNPETATHITNDHLFKDKELQTSTAGSPSKMKADVLALFPVSPTLGASTDQNCKVIDHRPRVIKALPHNPKSATESAKRIFKSIQEERKHL